VHRNPGGDGALLPIGTVLTCLILILSTLLLVTLLLRGIYLLVVLPQGEGTHIPFLAPTSEHLPAPLPSSAPRVLRIVRPSAQVLRAP
jgi:hypothetical protein